MTPCIEKTSLPVPHSHSLATITIDKRCYVNRKAPENTEKRIRITVFKKDARSVELSLDDAIALFEQGIALANAMKTQNY